MCKVSSHLKAQLVLPTLEGEARKTVMLQPAEWQESFEQIMSLLDDVYRDVSTEAVIRKSFFALYQ